MTGNTIQLVPWDEVGKRINGAFKAAGGIENTAARLVEFFGVDATKLHVMRGAIVEKGSVTDTSAKLVPRDAVVARVRDLFCRSGLSVQEFAERYDAEAYQLHELLDGTVVTPEILDAVGLEKADLFVHREPPGEWTAERQLLNAGADERARDEKRQRYHPAPVPAPAPHPKAKAEEKAKHRPMARNNPHAPVGRFVRIIPKRDALKLVMADIKRSGMDKYDYAEKAGVVKRHDAWKAVNGGNWTALLTVLKWAGLVGENTTYNRNLIVERDGDVTLVVSKDEAIARVRAAAERVGLDVAKFAMEFGAGGPTAALNDRVLRSVHLERLRGVYAEVAG